MVLRATSWWSEPRFDDVVARRLWRGPNHANAPTAGLARVPATHGVEIRRRRHGASWGHTVTSTTPRGRAFRPSGSVMANALWWARCGGRAVITHVGPIAIVPGQRPRR